jgi:hypothetical protein
MRQAKAKILKRTLQINDDRIALQPLSLEQTMALAIHLSPYVPLLEKYLPEIKRAFSDTSGNRPGLLFFVFKQLRAELEQAPADVIKLIAILLNKPTEWVTEHVTAAQIVGIIKELDSAYDFKAIWESAQLWATFRYMDTH